MPKRLDSGTCVAIMPRRTARTPGVPRQSRDIGPNGRRLCRGHARCGNETAPGRVAWCSDACQADTMVRGGWNVRHYVFERDKGICAKCGADADKARRVYHWAGQRHLRQYDAVYPCTDAQRIIRAAWGLSGYVVSFWEADHIVPVAEGGGGCGLDGYQSLCRPCHKEETRALRARLVDKKRNSGKMQKS